MQFKNASTQKHTQQVCDVTALCALVVSLISIGSACSDTNFNQNIQNIPPEIIQQLLENWESTLQGSIAFCAALGFAIPRILKEADKLHVRIMQQVKEDLSDTFA